jgi:photosystem II stability/assembly factor-like uncharacterized protein
MTMKRKFFLFATIFAPAFVISANAHAQWVPINGIGGSAVNAFAINGTNFFAGTNNGILLSTDSGITWTAVDSGLYDLNISMLFASGSSVLAVDKNYGVVSLWDSLSKSWLQELDLSGLYGISTADPYLYAYGPRELARSSDFGITWDVNDTFFHTLTCLTSVSTELFGGTSKGVAYSYDFGATWSLPDSGYLAGNSIYGIGSIGNVLLACTSSEIFRSTDLGESWTSVDTSGFYSFSSLFQYGSKLFVTASIGYLEGVLLSTDSGKTWSLSNKGLTSSEVQAVTSMGSTLYAGTAGDGIFRSSDSGATWHPGPTGIVGAFPGMIYHSQDGLFICGNSHDFSNESYDCGFLQSTDEGNTWLSDNPVPWTTNAQSFDDIDGKFFLAASLEDNTGGNYISSDRGLSWILDTSVGSIIRYANLGSDIFVSSETSGLLFSSDSSLNWQQSNGIDNLTLGLTASGDTFFAATYSGIFRSVDTGKNWEKVNTGLTDTDIWCLTAVGGDIFAGDNNGHGIFRSTNGGNEWFPANNGIANEDYVGSFAVSGSNIFVGMSGGVYLSTDLGDTWHNVNDGLPGMNSIGATSLAIDDSFLFAIVDTARETETYYEVFRRPLSEMISPAAVTPTPAAKQSIAAYPNPCATSSTITFSCTESGAGEVTILNLLGAEVARIYEGELSAGEHSFTWDASGAAPGMYECVVNINGNVQRIAIMCGAK